MTQERVPTREARRIFAGFMEGREERISAFVAEVAAHGGPAELLDRSLASLDVAWPWFTRLHLSGAPDGPPKTAAPSAGPEPPWWDRFNPDRTRVLGWRLAAAATGLADYFAACVEGAAPGAEWQISRARGTLHQPVLAIPGRGELPADLLVGTVVGAHAGIGNALRHPDALRRVAEVWLGLDPDHEARAAATARPLPPFIVEPEPGGRFTHRLTFDDEVAHRSQGRIRRLVRELRGLPANDEVVHDDREVVLLRARGSTSGELRDAVDRAWRSDGDQPHGAVGSDVT